MRRVVSVEPIFVVSDVMRALAHYEQLGFDFVEPQDFEYGSVRARMKIPMGTSFASDHRFGIRGEWLSRAERTTPAWASSSMSP